jgi:transposase-like protein
VKGSQLLLERARMSGEDAASARAVLEQQALTLKTENATLRRMNQNAKQKAQAAARAELAAAAKAAKLDDDDEYEGD